MMHMHIQPIEVDNGNEMAPILLSMKIIIPLLENIVYLTS